MINAVVASLAVVSAAILSAGAVVMAQQPTLSDIAACNEAAAAKTTPGALPGADLHVRTPRTAPRDGRHDAPGTGREKTDPSGGIITESPDPLVKGMDAGHAGDVAYRAAYRQCMERRTEPRR
jgi:hypothetical protein